MVRFTSSGNVRAREFFSRAIALDTTFVPAYVKLAITCMSEAGYSGNSIRSLPEAAGLAETWAEKALEIDPDDADAQSLLAYVGILMGRSEEAWQRISMALASSPNSHSVNGIKGLYLVFNGRPAEGREALLAALRLNPHDVRNATYLTQIATAHYFEHDYTSSVAAAKRAVVRYALYPQSYRWMAAALGQLGRFDEARKALKQAMDVSPPSFDLHMRGRPVWYRPEDYEHMLDGLRKAGWQG
jgi:adenylate cyclase